MKRVAVLATLLVVGIVSLTVVSGQAPGPSAKAVARQRAREFNARQGENHGTSDSDTDRPTDAATD